MKKCNKCQLEKDDFRFFKDKAHSSGLYSICKDCKKASTYQWRVKNKILYNRTARQWRAKNQKNCREYHLRRRFGITTEEYELKLANQNQRCAICQKHQNSCARRFAVDHAHHSKVVRALLCSNCNKGLGNFQEDSAILQRAAEYLEKF